MNSMKKIGLLSLALILMGQGCFGGSSSGADGALWRSEDGGNDWVQLAALPQATGVTSIAGTNVTSIEVDPSDDSVYYMGTQSNGLFYSLDHGGTWMRPEDTEIRNGEILNVEVHPDDVCTVYVLTTRSIWKSEDCMRTFVETFQEGQSDESLRAFVLDWFNPNILWVGNTAGDVIRSQDAGASWTTMYRVEDEVTSITVSNADSRIILVGSEDKGSFRSTNGGLNWTEQEDDLKKDYKNSDEVWGFAQNRDGSMLYMNTTYGIFRSTNAGQVWEPVSQLPDSNEVRLYSIAVDMSDGDIVYAATRGTLYRSTSGGDSWATEELPSSRAPLALLVHPRSPELVLMGFAKVKD
jgi:photosystem II stability/assembly factor-like uncharacterized protein